MFLSIEQTEAAARHFCKLNGQDPDEMVESQDENGNPQTVEAWRSVLLPILEHMAIHQSIAVAMQGTQPAPTPLKPKRSLVRIVPFNGSDKRLRGK